MTGFSRCSFFVSVVQNGSLRRPAPARAFARFGIAPHQRPRGKPRLPADQPQQPQLNADRCREAYFTKVEHILHQIADANDAGRAASYDAARHAGVHTRMLVGHRVIVPALPEFLGAQPEVRSTC